MPARLTPTRLLALAAVASIILLAGTHRWPIAIAQVLPRIDAAMGEALGLRAHSVGGASFVALPWPVLHIRDLELRELEASETWASVPVAKVRLNLWSWLTGRPRLVDVALLHPLVTLPPSGHSLGAAAIPIAALGLIERSSLRRLRLTGGEVEQGGIIARDVSFRMAGTGGTRHVEAQAQVAAGPVRLSADIEATAAGESRRLRLAVAGAGLAGSFEGRFRPGDAPSAEGRLLVTITAADTLARQLDLPADLMSQAQGTAISGLARLAGKTLQLRQARLEQGRSRFTGSIELGLRPDTPFLSATLAADNLDLTEPMTALAGRLETDALRSNDGPFDSRWFQAAALDLRLSARRAVVGPMQIDDVALSTHMRAGRLEAVLSGARLRGGALKGRLSMAAHQAGPLDWRAQGSVERADASFLADTLNLGRLRGSASGSFQLQGQASRPSELVANARGRAELELRDGEFGGYDLDQIMARRSVGPALLPPGRTRFSRLGTTLRLEDGRATLQGSHLVTPASRVSLEGALLLDQRTVDLTLQATPQNTTDPQDVRLRLEGPWAAPQLSRDQPLRLDRS